MSTKLIGSVTKFRVNSMTRLAIDDAGLEHALVAEAKETVVTDYNVIEHAHAHDVANFFQALGDVDVFRTRGGVTARMIVDKYHRGCGIAYYRIINFARMDKRGRKRTFGYLDFANFAIFVIQQNDVKELPLFAAEIFAKMMINVFRRPKRLAGLPFLAAHTPGDLKARLNLCDLGRANSLYGGELAGRGLVNSLKPAELVQQQARVIDGALAGAGIAV